MEGQSERGGGEGVSEDGEETIGDWEGTGRRNRWCGKRNAWAVVFVERTGGGGNQVNVVLMEIIFIMKLLSMPSIAGEILESLERHMDIQYSYVETCMSVRIHANGERGMDRGKDTERQRPEAGGQREDGRW